MANKSTHRRHVRRPPVGCESGEVPEHGQRSRPLFITCKSPTKEESGDDVAVAPEPPPGEADLRALSARFSEVEARLRALIGKAPAGDRRALYSEAAKAVIALRGEDYRAPVVTAYLAALRDADERVHKGDYRPGSTDRATRPPAETQSASMRPYA